MDYADLFWMNKWALFFALTMYLFLRSDSADVSNKISNLVFKQFVLSVKELM